VTLRLCSNNYDLLWKHITIHRRQYYGALKNPHPARHSICNCIINDDNTKVKHMCALFLRI